MGACVITPDTDPQNTLGHQRKVAGTLHLSNSYATSGDTFTVGQFGLVQLDELMLIGDGANAAQPVLSVDRTNNKILAYGKAASASGLTQIDATTDLSAIIFRFQAWGV